MLSNAVFKSIHPPVFEKTDDQKNRLREILRKNMLFHDLSAEDIEIMVDAFEPQEISKNKTVLKQGGKSEEFYILRVAKQRYGCHQKMAARHVLIRQNRRKVSHE